MANKALKFYEDEVVTFAVPARGMAWFDYVSRTSIHSPVTDWAYGEALERRCVDLSDGRPFSCTVDVADPDRRNFIKVIACMPEWEKLVCPLMVEVNGRIVHQKDDEFFEQVNLGWPALYIELLEGALKRGANEIRVTAGGGLYLSEVSVVSYARPKDLEQVSNLRYVRLGDRFAVAVKDENAGFSLVSQMAGCEFIESKRYKDLTLIAFKATGLGRACATAVFGDVELALDMPTIVDNADEFLFGIDGDDHRHDDSDETAFIVESAVMSGLGNYVQFRPQGGRNYYKLMSENRAKELVDLIDFFGMKYGLCDSGVVMDFLPEIRPSAFFGYHIHEPYLFFNPELAATPEGKEMWLCDEERMKAVQSFAEGKANYMQVLRESKAKFSKERGSTSFGSPSLLCVYEGDAGVDRITIEPVSNLNLLVGAVRATDLTTWGAHVPTDWYFGVPVDAVKSNKYRLAMQYLYLSGADYMYAENSLYKTNAFERCDWESEFCAKNRQYQREFYDFALKNPRKGKLIVNKAVLYGKNEFFMWKLNDRIAELKEKDWDSYVWGKWDNAYQIAWNAVEAWLPTSKRQNVHPSPLNKELFSGTPYGNVDVVGIEKDFFRYDTLALLGWNTMDEELLARLAKYVYDGGKLALCVCHLNTVDRNDRQIELINNEILGEFLGFKITGRATARGTINASGEEICLSGTAEIATIELDGAEVVLADGEGKPLVVRNAYGKGLVYVMTYSDYVKSECDTGVHRAVLKMLGEQSAERVDNDSVSFTVRETEDEYIISVLNMNCIEGASERFKLTYYGHEIEDNIAVGEVKEYTIKK